MTTRIIGAELKAIAKLAMEMEPLPNIRLSEPDQKYHQFLYLLCKFQEPDRVVELGTYRGEGAKYMGLGCPTAEVWTVDVNPNAKIVVETEDEIVPNVKAFTDNSINFVNDDYDDEPIDLLFIDANHDYSLTIMNYRLYSPLVPVGGIIVFDDWTLDAEMLRVKEELLQDPKLEIHEFPKIHKTGWAVAIKVAE